MPIVGSVEMCHLKSEAHFACAGSKKNNMSLLLEILQQRRLNAFFQPIIDLKKGKFIGFEGLIRGPADSSLHSPANLFGAVQQYGLTPEMEMLSRQTVLEAFSYLRLPGKLFLNTSPEALTHPYFKNGHTLQYMKKLGISPDRVIIELTENHPIYDYDAMRSALLHYRSQGFKIALDDLGEGFSSLRLWSELRPDFIKIDKHFVQGVDTDSVKMQFLKAIQCIAESCDTHVIAEGVETTGELMAVRDLGIQFGQGYLVARPTPVPPLFAAPEMINIIHSAKYTGAGWLAS